MYRYVVIFISWLYRSLFSIQIMSVHIYVCRKKWMMHLFALQLEKQRIHSTCQYKTRCILLVVSVFIFIRQYLLSMMLTLNEWMNRHAGASIAYEIVSVCMCPKSENSRSSSSSSLISLFVHLSMHMNDRDILHCCVLFSFFSNVVRSVSRLQLGRVGGGGGEEERKRKKRRRCQYQHRRLNIFVL